jgi:transglutaminase-like putative cysteine protease
MKLSVLHRTHYDYAAPVKASFNEARLQPTSQEGQNCHSFELRLSPSAPLKIYYDFYSNIVHFFELPEPHKSLTIESHSIVSTSSRILDEDLEVAGLDQLQGLAMVDRCFDFLQTSALLSLDAEVWRLAMDATVRCWDIWQASLAIMRFIHANFAYSPLATDVNTPMSEVIQMRKGVCQDFAHVMIGMCRTLKIPARYVSGYIYNGPHDRLNGAQASHAWCEVYLPGIGWQGLDPTNNRQVDEHHVKIGSGRDYADIIPVKGHYRGTPEKTMSVEVKVSLAE